MWQGVKISRVLKLRPCSVFSVSINPVVELIRNSFGGILGNLSAFLFLWPAVPGGFRYAGGQNGMGDGRAADTPVRILISTQEEIEQPRTLVT